MTLPNQEATNNKSSDTDSMTTEFNKNVYQDLAPKQLRAQDLRKQESIRKMSNWERQMLEPSLPSRKKFW